MTYRQSKKRREQNKRWSERSNAKQAQQRIAAADPLPLDSIDRTIHITIQRPGTNPRFLGKTNKRSVLAFPA